MPYTRFTTPPEKKQKKTMTAIPPTIYHMAIRSARRSQTSDRVVHFGPFIIFCCRFQNVFVQSVIFRTLIPYTWSSFCRLSLFSLLYSSRFKLCNFFCWFFANLKKGLYLNQLSYNLDRNYFKNKKTCMYI